MLTQQKQEIWRIQHFEGDVRSGVFGDYHSEEAALEAAAFFEETNPNPETSTYRVVHFTKVK